jgi:hypothetical protein
MNGGIKRNCILGLLFLLGTSLGLAMDNPLSVPLDSSIIRHNGRFYGMGAQTNGHMWVSDNLVEWGSPAFVLSKEISGPYELLCRNGFFYLYSYGQEIAVSAHPLDPFSMFRKAPLSGEHMRMFQDKSGSLFSVSRRYGSKKEGEVWLQRYSNPWQPSSRPVRLLDGRRGMWDALDGADLGEPEMLNYRDNYYLLYAANHPGPRTGLREIGVAVNKNPLQLKNTDKLPEPVLVRNVERLARTYSSVLPSGEYTKWEGRYTTQRPGPGWSALGFKMSGWRTADGGFGYPGGVDGAQLHACRTKWTANQIWVRRTFDLTKGVPETPVLNIRHEGAVQVFLNGKKVYESKTPSVAYSNFDISEASVGAFRPGENILAVHAVVPRNAEYRFLDFGLLDAGDLPVEPTVYGLDDPCIVTGANGFEKWMAYRAWWNGELGTGLDRVFFFDDEMVIDGPTTIKTPGYHPPPARPTFSDTFSGDAPFWRFEGGRWSVEEGVMRQTHTKALAKAFLKQTPAVNYLFEINFRLPKTGGGSVGVVAWSNGRQEMIVSINPTTRMWEYRVPGSLAPKRFKLPAAVQLSEKPASLNDASVPLHRMRVTKNGGRFEVMLDEIRLTPDKPIITPLQGAGVPGLYCDSSSAEFDGVVYTIGWDEHDAYITGWGAARDGTPAGGKWELHKNFGLEQRKHSEPGRAFKGDLLNQYEFSVNARMHELEEGKEQLYGIFPVFADRNNYLKAMIDTRARQLVVSGKLDGKKVGPFSSSLNCRIPRRHLARNTAHSDIDSWVYGLRSQSIITGFDIRWLEGDYDYLQKEFLVPSDEIKIRYAKLQRDQEPPILWDDGRFRDADEPHPNTQKPGVLNHVAIRSEAGNYISFGSFIYVPSARVIDSITGDFLRWLLPGEILDPKKDEEMEDGPLNIMASDTRSHPQEVLVNVEVESSYFFRCVKLKDRVIIELNGQPMLTVDGEWPPSQVGLVTEGQPCYYNGITLMHLPE